MFEEFKLTKDLPEKCGYYVINNNQSAYKEPVLIQIKNGDNLEFWRKYGGYFSKRLEIAEVKTAVSHTNERNERVIEQSKLEQLLREIRYAYAEGFGACQFEEEREDELFALSAAAKVIDNYGKEFNIRTNTIQ